MNPSNHKLVIFISATLIAGLLFSSGWYFCYKKFSEELIDFEVIALRTDIWRMEATIKALENNDLERAMKRQMLALEFKLIIRDQIIDEFPQQKSYLLANPDSRPIEGAAAENKQ